MEDVIRMGKKLQKMSSSDSGDHGSAYDLLEALRRQRITLEILQKSRIGMIVNDFRKSCKDEKIVALAKKLIKDWKRLLPATGSPSSGSMKRSNSNVSSSSSPKDNDEPREKKERKNLEPQNSTDSGEDRDSRGEAGDGDHDSSSAPPPPVRRKSVASETGDPIRLKCRNMLADALKTPPGVENGHDPDALGAEIEDSIFDEFQSTSVKYKNRVRSRIQNLKDARNPELRQNVLIGLIQPEKLACMTSEEMASKEMKDLRAKLTKEAINDHQMAVNTGTSTDMFKCGKCGGKNCTYNQLQTRSADEPMTTFVLCNLCGNRWKFC